MMRRVRNAVFKALLPQLVIHAMLHVKQPAHCKDTFARLWKRSLSTVLRLPFCFCATEGIEGREVGHGHVAGEGDI